MRQRQVSQWVLLPLLLILSACTRSPEAQAAKHLQAATAWMQKRDYDRALVEARTAIQAMPKSAEAYYQLGLAFAGNGDLGRAVTSYQRALELDPRHHRAELELARLMAAFGNERHAQEAESRLKALLADSVGTPDTLNALAFTELRLGRPEEAMKYLERAVTVFPQQVNSALLFAEIKLNSGDVSGAEEILKKLVQGTPKSVEARALLGAFYQSRGRMPEAEQALREALSLDANSGLVLRQLASLDMELGKTSEAEQIYRRLSVYSEREYRPLYSLFLYQMGRKPEALKEFERVYKKDPQDREARTRLVAAYNAMGQRVDAEKVLAASLKKNPKDLDALIQRGELFLNQKQYTRAEVDFSQVQHLQPNSPEIHYLQAKLNQARGNNLVYRQELGEALRLNPGLLTVRLEMAQNLLQAGDPKSALDFINAAPEAQKQQPNLVAARNWAFWSLGDLAEMRKGVDQGLSYGRTPQFLIQDGLYKLRTGNPAGARKVLEEALAMDPSDLLALQALNQSYQVLKEAPLAVAKVKEYAARQPQSAEIQEFLGQLLVASGDRAGARAAFTAAQQADSQFTEAALSQVRLDALEGQWDVAKNRLEAVLKMGDSGNSTPRLWLAVIEQIRGENGKAIGSYRQVLQLNPNNAQAANNLAYLLAGDSQHVNEALKYAQKAVELDPARPSYADTLGWILYQKGLYSEAIPYLEKASVPTASAVGKYHLAMAYAKTGDQRGRKMLDVALKQNPQLAEAKVAREVVAGSGLR